jgi:hypothetical protein
LVYFSAFGRILQGAYELSYQSYLGLAKHYVMHKFEDQISWIISAYDKR